MFFGNYSSLGATTDPTALNIVAGFLKANPNPTSEEVKELFNAIPLNKWSNTTTALLSSGVSPTVVHSGSSQAASGKLDIVKDTLTVTAAAMAAYHGTKRNSSIFWGGVWFVMGLTFPVLSTILSFGQGFAKKK